MNGLLCQTLLQTQVAQQLHAVVLVHQLIKLLLSSNALLALTPFQKVYNQSGNVYEHTVSQTVTQQ